MIKLLYDFSTESNPTDWQIVNDGVMGGLSQGNFTIDEKGNGVFYGNVSTENNGGFSSVRHAFEPQKVSSETKIIINLKGDCKDYQFRIKDKLNSSHSYITTFSTDGTWQKIELFIKDFFPSFRGRKLDMPNFDKESIEEIWFLIGNKKDESFRLLISTIELV